MNNEIILKKEIARLHIQLGNTQLYVIELEQQIQAFEDERKPKPDAEPIS